MLYFNYLVQTSGYCDEPPIVANARHNAPQEQNSFAPDTELQYQCCKSIRLHLITIKFNSFFFSNEADLGYNTLGFARARCLQYNQTVKWFGPDFKCEGKEKYFKFKHSTRVVVVSSFFLSRSFRIIRFFFFFLEA